MYIIKFKKVILEFILTYQETFENTEMSDETSDHNIEKLVIIGSGPAGHTAAIYSI